uniref:Uncharacterized protein n=1 Tax=Chromera velia CCMP2878 TaxID=1169474 RepID=A0A0G4GXV6_9ALVE|eukprot:Cvel_23836.t1-p1 / transcript=Cvel_23836.t1 / gene=Cvel_23836 / organism=Chromera_velia_CCMP2878 / gene_product=hypothetical protein / transcript_product=hypothetical protein / location=Cvel_scaffold2506:12793-16736(-) / protein_length=402 / sequence_SO=supercontig / SO=protein_coding / is_pseudo=false
MQFRSGKFVFLSCVLNSAAGLGGGALYSSIFMVIGGMSPKEAVPVGSFLIFAAGIFTTSIYIRKRFPDGSLVIDLNLVCLVIPLSAAGTGIGVYLQKTLPQMVLMINLASFLLLLCMKSTFDATRKFVAERDALKTAQANEANKNTQVTPAEETGGALSRTGSRSEGPLSNLRESLLGKGAVEVLERSSSQGGNSTSLHARSNGDAEAPAETEEATTEANTVTAEEKEKEKEKENRDSLVYKLICLGLVVSCLAVNPLVKHFLELWIALPLGAAYCLVISIYFCVSIPAKKAMGPSGKPWTVCRCLIFAVTGLLAGVLSGLLGLGGGTVLNPLFQMISSRKDARQSYLMFLVCFALAISAVGILAKFFLTIEGETEHAMEPAPLTVPEEMAEDLPGVSPHYG